MRREYGGKATQVLCLGLCKERSQATLEAWLYFVGISVGTLFILKIIIYIKQMVSLHM